MKTTHLLPVISLLLLLAGSSCQRHFTSQDALNNISAFKNCDSDCAKKQEAYIAAYGKCLTHVHPIPDCDHIPDPGARQRCILLGIERHNREVAECDTQNRPLKDAAAQCRLNCVSHLEKTFQ